MTSIKRENKSSKKTIVFTGGGSGGHVIPALTLISELRKDNYDLLYIGGRNGVERELVDEIDIPYHAIFTGKLRRYFSLENFIDLFKVGFGFLQAFLILLPLKSKNTLLFSTGGFVCVPVVLAAWLLRIKIYIHEQTTRVGLANKICSKFASKVFVSFEESLQFFPQEKVSHSGYPLRRECFDKDVSNWFVDDIDLQKISKPILFVTGGGNGSLLINDLIKKYLPKLTQNYFVIHQVGKNSSKEFQAFKSKDYLPLAFVKDEMIDLYKIANVIISRSGAGTVSELMAIGKPSLFIPLKIAQKNEQYHNAQAASSRLGSIIIEEDELETVDLLEKLEEIEKNRIQGSIADCFPNGLLKLLEEIRASFT